MRPQILSRFSLPLAAVMAMFLPLTIFAAAHADDASVGGDGRVFAMGGAGLALPYAGGDRMNPASLAYEKKAFGLAVPSGSFINDGISADKISKALTDNSASAAGDLLRDYATSDRTVGTYVGVSVRVSKFELSLDGATRGYIQPNAALSNWARTGNGNPLTLPLNSRADLIVGGVGGFGLATGATLPVPSDTAYNYAVGLKAKYLAGIYSHYVADANVLLANSNDAFQAPEIGGDDYLLKRGLAADVGFYRQPRGGQGLKF